MSPTGIECGIAATPRRRLRAIDPPFVVSGPCGVAVRGRLKGLTSHEVVLRLVGGYLGSLASRDLKAGCADGLDHGNEAWAAIEDLDFEKDKTREKHGRRKRFRELISGMPTAKLRARLTSMADHTGIAVIAVDPAYTTKWGAQHWQKPLTCTSRRTTRHDAASIAIGRRAQGHPIRRRTAPPPVHRSDEQGHRTAQARPGTLRRQEPRHPATDRAHDAPRRAGRTRRTRGTSASKTVRDARSTGQWANPRFLDTG